MTPEPRQHWKPNPQEQIQAADTPPDAYGPGYIIYSLASDFHALCCLIGAEAARQELAEVVNTELAGRYRHNRTKEATNVV